MSVRGSSIQGSIVSGEIRDGDGSELLREDSRGPDDACCPWYVLSSVLLHSPSVWKLADVSSLGDGCRCAFLVESTLR